MKRIAFLLIAVAAVAGFVAFTAPASGHVDGEAAPIFGITIRSGYRDWKLISVAHEAGNNNDIRAILSVPAARHLLTPTFQNMPRYMFCFHPQVKGFPEYIGNRLMRILRGTPHSSVLARAGMEYDFLIWISSNYFCSLKHGDFSYSYCTEPSCPVCPEAFRPFLFLRSRLQKEGVGVLKRPLVPNIPALDGVNR
jgi:hypothetical protein